MNSYLYKHINLEDKSTSSGYIISVVIITLIHVFIILGLSIFTIIPFEFFVICIITMISTAAVFDFLRWLSPAVPSFLKSELFNTNIFSYIFNMILFSFSGYILMWLFDQTISNIGILSSYLKFIKLFFLAVPMLMYFYSLRYLVVNLRYISKYMLLNAIGGLISLHLTYVLFKLFHLSLLETLPFYKKTLKAASVNYFLIYLHWVWFIIIPALMLVFHFMKYQVNKHRENS
ncbi:MULTISPECIES: hypothetical protein [Bacillus cereus group]|uniref:Uncharacterized protein n=1 Tax=Bacillus thuringiensis subsp. jegathesan TaxID=56955 RepID=A0A9X6MF11_BACTJ|nr:hypothetical protein [Bacillus thuringiensis]OUB76832.1 hypothetical protein BK750_02870 [Bacillus thuringiensis serovar jegathesan]